VITITTRSEEIKKKKVTQQVKKKKIILKRNERINDEHDKYVKRQEKKDNRDKSNNMKIMSRMNQSEEFQEFDDEKKEQKMIKYLEDESMMISQNKSISQVKKKDSAKIKIIKEQVKKLMMLKELKVSDSIRVMKDRSRFDVQKMMNIMMSLSMSQLFNENQQLRREMT
jgi:hypothetical protein